MYSYFQRILESKRDKLLEQLDEAKKLKESIDRRSVSVSNILYKYLTSEEYADYDHFINMKAKLIMDSKEIADKIKLGEEQLMALKETLIVTDWQPGWTEKEKLIQPWKLSMWNCFTVRVLLNVPSPSTIPYFYRVFFGIIGNSTVPV